MTERRILVTAALPYANGHIHIGHLVEYLQTDIWVRFQKLRGHRCVFVCADDTHGTAIMIRARQEGRTEEEVIADMKAAHERDFAGFDVAFDNYGSTNSPENRKLCEEIWLKVTAAGLVIDRNVTQLYDTEAETFLADRFVRGTCPVCKTPGQYGDHCGQCLSTYAPTDLIDPKSTLSGTTPEVRESPHKFIQLEQMHDFLEAWSQSGEHLQPEVANYLKGHFLGDAKDSNNPRKELRDWDVTRPPEYFGFEIPDFPNNFWYVWFDAPIGYMASTAQWCEKQGEKFDDWWKSPQTEVHHFIGKDITYFHTLFWPAVLKASGYSLPTKVHIHGFLTVDGRKMSKSEGTFIQASTYLEHLDPAYLRYYYASKLGSRLDDLDLNRDEFVTKVNADLVGKVVNLASRTSRFIADVGLAKAYPDDGGLFAGAAAQGEAIAAAYEDCDYNKAMRLIMELADKANFYVESQAPWNLRKDPDQADKLQEVCTVSLNLFRQLALYLAPVLPRLAEQTGKLLNQPIASWDEAQTPVVGNAVSKFEHMMKRVEPQQVQAMIDASKQTEEAPAPQFEDGPEALAAEPMAEECTIDDFGKVDMRVARVLKAEEVPEAKKLLKLELSLGGEERRQVFAGIKGVYEPATLIGRLVICCANLAPRKMRFGTSEGMVLAAGPGGTEIFLLAPDSGAKPGQRVH